MSGAEPTAGAGALVLHQQPAEDPAAVARVLTDAFSAARDALLAGRAVVLVLDDRDLLGQRRVEDAAVATALLGLVRALAIEGARPGWSVNAVSVRDETAALDETCRWLSTTAGMSGQLLRLGGEHLGKVLP